MGQILPERHNVKWAALKGSQRLTYISHVSARALHHPGGSEASRGYLLTGSWSWREDPKAHRPMPARPATTVSILSRFVWSSISKLDPCPCPAEGEAIPVTAPHWGTNSFPNTESQQGSLPPSPFWSTYWFPPLMSTARCPAGHAPFALSLHLFPPPAPL